MILLIIATRNTHKVQEIRAVLSEEFDYRTLNELPGAPPTVEDANSFAGNATKKSVQLAHWLTATLTALAQVVRSASVNRIYCLADDSGLEVDALRGAPGVHSARFAALDSGSPGNSDDQANNAKLLRLLAGIPWEERTARFRCVIALTPVIAPRHEASSPVCYGDEAEWQTELFEGACEGRISDTARGTQGFGYDPLFFPKGFSQSFAELGDAVKNQISHRSQALRELRNWLRRQGQQKP